MFAISKGTSASSLGFSLGLVEAGLRTALRERQKPLEEPGVAYSYSWLCIQYSGRTGQTSTPTSSSRFSFQKLSLHLGADKSETAERANLNHNHIFKIIATCTINATTSNLRYFGPPTAISSHRSPILHLSRSGKTRPSVATSDVADVAYM